MGIKCCNSIDGIGQISYMLSFWGGRKKKTGKEPVFFFVKMDGVILKSTYPWQRLYPACGLRNPTHYHTSS